jgi:hypothetical protein
VLSGHFCVADGKKLTKLTSADHIPGMYKLLSFQGSLPL